MLRSWIAESIDTKDASTVDAVMRSEMGILVPASGEFSKSVLLLRVSTKELFERWFPGSERHETEIGEGAKLGRTVDGRMLGIRDGIVAVARKSTNGRLFREVLRLMSGRSSQSVARDGDYLQLRPYLPAKDLVSVYVPSMAISKSSSNLSGLGVRSVLAAAYKEESQINIAVRASRNRAARLAPLSEQVIEQLMGLPKETIVAYADSWPNDAKVEGNVAHFASLMFPWFLPIYEPIRAVHVAAGPSPPIPIVLAVSQGLMGESHGTPQLTVLIQTPKARLLCAEIVASLGELARKPDEAEEAGTTPIEAQYSNQQIWYFPACPDPSRSEKLECLLGIEPAWTSIGDWFILSSTRGQLQQVLDAQNGKSERLGSVPEAAALRSRRAPRTALFLAQPSLARGLFDRWIEDASRAEDSFTHVAWDIASDLTPPERGDRIGISARAEQIPGAVIVARVDGGTPAYDALKVDDRIIGADGILLSLSSPNADLRSRWEKLQPRDRIVFRVERDATILETELVKPEPTASSTSETVPSNVVAALRGLRDIARCIPEISISFPATDENHLSAFVSIRVAPPAGEAASR